jgi:hypothetical protein
MAFATQNAIAANQTIFEFTRRIRSESRKAYIAMTMKGRAMSVISVFVSVGFPSPVAPPVIA